MKKSIVYSSILLFFAGIFFVTNDAIINYLSQTDVKFYHFIFYGIPIFLCFPLYLLINGSSTATITMRLGASGNTITLLPNRNKFVATDGTNWYELKTGSADYIEKTGAYTAFAGDNIFVDTSAGAITITLPSSPSQGDTVSFIDAEGTFDTNNLTVEPGSEKIMANTAGDEMVVDTNNAAFALVYQDSTFGWRFKNK